MHVDAFFEYLLNKVHIYWTRVPKPGDPAPDHGRDGVLPEEDLALRALMPEMKPKRGRRKADDRDADSDFSRSPAQRPRLHSPAFSEDFTLGRASVTGNSTPGTAEASSHTSFPSNPNQATAHRGFGSFDGQTPPEAAVPHSNDTNSWRPRENETPFSAFPLSDYSRSAYPQSTLYPQSAMLPRGTNPFSFADEPQSAVTPSKGRPRRRNGPAVSSAWLSNSSANSGKLRGRPPSNRDVTDGPFSTFPANPQNPPAISLRDPTPTQTPVVERAGDGEKAFSFNPTDTQRSRASRGSLLHLQVPDRVGAPVRLATPPPVISAIPSNPSLHYPPGFPMGGPSSFSGSSATMNNTNMNRSHSTESVLSVSGRPEAPPLHQYPQYGDPGPPQSSPFCAGTNPLPTDPKSEAEVVMEDRTNVHAIELAVTHLILTADWYDVAGNPTKRCTMKEAMLISKQMIIDMCNEAPTKEMFLLSLCALVGANSLLTSLKMRRFVKDKRTTRFGFKWQMKFGAVDGGYVKTLEISEAALGKEGVRAMGDEWDGEEESTADEWTEGPVTGKGGTGKSSELSVPVAMVEKKILELTSVVAEKEKRLREMRTDIMSVLLEHDRK